MRIKVTQLGGEGGYRRGVLDTAERGTGDGCWDLVEQAALEVPPPYRPVAGMPVYQIDAGDNVVLVAEQELAGPLRDLVMTVLTDGDRQPSPAE